MRCPNCFADLKSQNIVGRMGQKIKIKKCNLCGGFWMKTFNLFDFNDLTAQEIDSVTDQPQNYHKKMFCPKCDQQTLKNYNHYNVPLDLHYKRCAHCGGVWSFAGKILEFKDRQNHLSRVASSISNQTRMVLTLTFSFLFGILLYANYSVFQGKLLFEAAETNAGPFEKTNFALVAYIVISFLLTGTLMIIWGKYRKLGWIFNFCALFIIIFYLTLRLTNYYPFLK
ncbi:MAG: zf-TFIIB domain-containing protein [Patescibacteria group bacterium]|jgi:Zn-finger nucleic acid-binding protein